HRPGVGPGLAGQSHHRLRDAVVYARLKHTRMSFMPTTRNSHDKERQPTPQQPDVNAVPEKVKGQPQLLRGMKDILPVDQPYWKAVIDAVDGIARGSAFDRIDTPVLEAASLFTRTVGQDTDIVDKEMYTFLDKSGDKLALRPENTASVARAYLEHGMVSWPQPVRLFYMAPFFRHDRPQAGRYRQFWQFGFEVLGDGHPVVDAQVIYLGVSVYKQLGIPVNVQINSIGDKQCRPGYIRQLSEYFKSRKNSLCEDCKRRLTKNPLRILDCKVPDCHTVSQDAPQTVDHLCEACKEHFVRVLEYLDELNVPYTLNPRIVRGLDYYTRTVFQIVEEGAEEQTGQSDLGGGGRYDDLLHQLGNRDVPAVGYTGGIERLILKMHERNVKPSEPAHPDLFLAQLGEPARKKALKLYDVFRSLGIGVAESFSKDGLKQQLEAANRLKASFALIIGQKEMMDDTILIRDMESGIQEVVDFKKVVPEMQKRLSKAGPMATPPVAPAQPEASV
ncbi:MAG: histidine--tRNA ligase, partial [Candidatus Kerfeldbacteria bacterium]|nr:histidine--tRNA ligase [Candidatus Kerfeldbacteria bacterium]